MRNLLLIQVLRKFALVLRCVALLDKCKLVLCCSCQESSPPRPPQLDLLSCICSPAHRGAHAGAHGGAHNFRVFSIAIQCYHACKICCIIQIHDETRKRTIHIVCIVVQPFRPFLSFTLPVIPSPLFS